MKQQGHSKEIMNWGPEYLLKTYFDSEGSLWKIHREWWIFFTYNSISLIYNIDHLM